MYNLTFEFSLEKLVQAIAYFSSERVPSLTKLKIAKLLYFADKQHLLEHGKPIIGDVYWCMDYGPVPSFALNEMSAAISGAEIPGALDASLFSRVLTVKKFLRTQPLFEVREDAYDPRVFSESEQQALRYTKNMYGYRTAAELVDLTHLEPTWLIPNSGRPAGSRSLITYDLFFEGAPDKARRYLGQLVADQFGVAIPLAGDTEYSQFASDLSSHSFVPDGIPESDVKRAARYSRV